MQMKDNIYLSYSFDKPFITIKNSLIRKDGENIISCEMTQKQNSDNVLYLNNLVLENLTKLDKISDLKENWNEEGAPSISKDVIQKAKRAIIVLDIQPEIFPVADNSVQFEYSFNDSYLELQFYRNNIEVFVIRCQFYCFLYSI